MIVRLPHPRALSREKPNPGTRPSLKSGRGWGWGQAYLPWIPLCLILLAACTAAPTPTPTPTATPATSAITLTQTPQTDAPALLLRDGQITAAWIGSDQRGVHQDARTLSGDTLGDVITLPLPPTYPYDQQLFPAADGGLQLLWLELRQQRSDHALFGAALARSGGRARRGLGLRGIGAELCGGR